MIFPEMPNNFLTAITPDRVNEYIQPKRVDIIHYFVNGNPMLDSTWNSFTFTHKYFESKDRFSYSQANITALSSQLFQGSRRTTDEEYDAINEAFRRSLKRTTTRKNRK